MKHNLGSKSFTFPSLLLYAPRSSTAVYVPILNKKSHFYLNAYLCSK